MTIKSLIQIFQRKLPLVLLITIFEWLFGLGGQILSLNKKAEFDEDGSNHYFTTAMLTTIVASVLIILTCFPILG